MHETRKRLSIEARKVLKINAPRDGFEILVACDKASNFNVEPSQLKGTTKSLTFYTCLVRLPVRYLPWTGLTNQQLENTNEHTKLAYLYFFDSKTSLKIRELVIYFQRDLRQKLNIFNDIFHEPGKNSPHSIRWISDGAQSEMKSNFQYQYNLENNIKNEVFCHGISHHLQLLDGAVDSTHGHFCYHQYH